MFFYDFLHNIVFFLFIKLSLCQGKGILFEIFKIQVDDIILPWVADRVCITIRNNFLFLKLFYLNCYKTGNYYLTFSFHKISSSKIV